MSSSALPLWKHTNFNLNKCAKTAGFKDGYIMAADCLELNPYVCSTAPLYKEADNFCPANFYQYRDECILLNQNKLNQTLAAVRSLSHVNPKVLLIFICRMSALNLELLSMLHVMKEKLHF